MQFTREHGIFLLLCLGRIDDSRKLAQVESRTFRTMQNSNR